MGATAETALIFETSAGAIYDPLKIKSEFNSPDSVDVTLTNYHESETLTDLGIYIRPSSNLGPWDNPPEQPPASDYQDLLMWGTRSEADPSFEGGVKVTAPAGSGETFWLTRERGGYYSNRVPIPSLGPSDSMTITIEFIVPAEEAGAEWKSILDSRRMFVAVVVG